MTEERQIVSVGQVNDYVKRLLEQNTTLRGIYIRGEISNLKYQSSGHIYFTLKDEAASMSAVMFKFNAMGLKFKLENGMKVICRGKITLYQVTGSYQINIEEMEPDGVGALYIAYEQLKRKLESEGVFSGPKMDLPEFPKRIGIITSRTGAALHDMINVTSRRWPVAELVLYPAQVQGVDAPPTLIEAVEYFSNTKSVDVVIIGRGGGSIEDLWVFNDEMLARTVAKCEVPIVSAVGHETDFTLCDFAADRRAPTPSAAAELVVPDINEVMYMIEGYGQRIKNILNQRITRYKDKLERLKKSRVLVDIMSPINIRRENLGYVESRLYDRYEVILNSKKAKLGRVSAKLEVMSPLKVVSRGYSAVFDDNKNVIKSVKQLNVDDNVSFMVTDGTVNAKVIGIEESTK
ncbi:MAG: exodeoxyribonuclease VII large subunit [Clostridia bacterium]|nr:exodeoxyribonuclease VII large subunit [Clostridia bacterium]